MFGVGIVLVVILLGLAALQVKVLGAFTATPYSAAVAACW